MGNELNSTSGFKQTGFLVPHRVVPNAMQVPNCQNRSKPFIVIDGYKNMPFPIAMVSIHPIPPKMLITL